MQKSVLVGFGSEMKGKAGFESVLMGFGIKISFQNCIYEVVVITCISRRGNLHSRRSNTKVSVVVTVEIFVVVTCNADWYEAIAEATAP